MTEYQEYVERIFKYFSSEISAELYWKLFIFANFTNSDQTQSFSDIRKALKQESKNISSKSDSFYNRFTNITQTNLESSLKRFNSEKIKRVLQYSTQEQLIRIIHVTTFNKWIQDLYPLPCAMGIATNDYWDWDSMDMVLKFFFNTTEIYEIRLPDEVNIIEFLLSKRNVTYLYFFNHATTYPPDMQKFDTRNSRKWDHTVFTALFNSERIPACKQNRKSVALSYNYHIDFYDYYRTILTQEIRQSDFKTSCIALFYIPKNAEQLFDFSSTKMFPCPFLIFHSYEELLAKSRTCNSLPSKLGFLRGLTNEMNKKCYQMSNYQEYDTVKDNLEDLFMFQTKIQHTQQQ